jgi:beta-lactamase class D
MDEAMQPGRVYLLIILFIMTACSPVASPQAAREEIRPDLEKYFQGFDGAFVLYDMQNDHYIRYNPEKSAVRLLPASTFKIINALIGLETGVIPDENYVIPWDGIKYETESWNQDRTLKTAFQNSVVWYYQEVARRVGSENMQHYIDAVGYGNQDMTGNLDSFWLDGALRISADEQMEFLKRLYRNDLPFSKRSMGTVKDMMIVETKPELHLCGKTGTALRVDSQFVGWFVGYQKVNGNVYIFATNITSDSPDANGTKAREISLNILQDLTK